ncbi:MAG: methionyl-tRNA formyltransferase [Lachnospiraceae bacterium]|nr:methionyl-tRNA formyltransferase [Lachnospiraceae bacterium]
MKIVFMGTPDFAVGTLDALHAAGHQILAAVSQPDKPKGRHAELQPTPVKERAMQLGIPVLQPVKADDPAFLAQLSELAPEVIVVTAYGKLLKKELLELPPHGCINVHASLLPRWRGAAPIQWAVIEGDPKAGVCTMQMDEGLDTGDVLMRSEIVPAPDETGGSLFDKLSVLGGELIVETLAALEAGTLTRTPQGEEGMTYARMLTKDMGEIDWREDAVKIERLVRGLYPWPGTYTHTGGKLLKIHKAALPAEGSVDVADAGQEPGSAVVKDGRLFAVCGSGVLELLEVQPEGKKRMAAADYLRGYHPERFE